MKLYLNEQQRAYLLEILRASEANAINGNDPELAKEFAEIYAKVEPENALCINLKRSDAEVICEFCEIVRLSLDKTLQFIESDKSRSQEELDDLKQRTTYAKEEIESIWKQLQDKIKSNPV